MTEKPLSKRYARRRRKKKREGRKQEMVVGLEAGVDYGERLPNFLIR